MLTRYLYSLYLSTERVDYVLELLKPFLGRVGWVGVWWHGVQGLGVVGFSVEIRLIDIKDHLAVSNRDHKVF